jgi:hypothetical protein
MNDEQIADCCGEQPTVFEMRPGDWAVHCKQCWEGVGPRKTRAEAVREWNEMNGKEPK